jgi:hypothetical protein
MATPMGSSSQTQGVVFRQGTLGISWNTSMSERAALVLRKSALALGQKLGLAPNLVVTIQ